SSRPSASTCPKSCPLAPTMSTSASGIPPTTTTSSSAPGGITQKQHRSSRSRRAPPAHASRARPRPRPRIRRDSSSTMPPSLGPEASRSPTIRGAALLGVAVGILLRVYLARAFVGHAYGDNAIIALEAKHALHGHFYAFHWGQSYMGTLEALVIAGF